MRAFGFAQTLVLLSAFFHTFSTAAWSLASTGTTLRKHLAYIKPLQTDDNAQPHLQNQNQNQHPLMEAYPPSAVLPATSAPAEDTSSSMTSESKSGPIVVSDVLPKIKGINIFASLTRTFEPIATRLNDSSHNVTVLAPRNSAIQNLPRKPWESPEDYEAFGEQAAYQGSEGEDRAKRNLRRFVEAHLIPVCPWRGGEEGEEGTIGGGRLRWVKREEKIYIQPGDVEVDHIAAQVSNGEVWVLNGVINYQ